MAETMRRFAATYDLHFGWESVGGHKKPLHDPRAWGAALQFFQDFKPQDFFFGGDVMDCGAISHWNKGKPRKTEGFRLLKDAEDCYRDVIQPVEALLPRDGQKAYLIGNHEAWIDDLLDTDPALEGLVDIKKLLHLDKWQIVEQGRSIKYGKLHFIHGDTIKGGIHCAKKAVDDYGRNIRFGHFHTLQTFTKTSPLDNELPHTGVAIPCLCSKDVGFMKRSPNRWVQGFLWGYMSPTGVPFEEHVAVIINGQMSVNGKIYRG